MSFGWIGIKIKKLGSKIKAFFRINCWASAWPPKFIETAARVANLKRKEHEKKLVVNGTNEIL